jgi:hypothetical protein
LHFCGCWPLLPPQVRSIFVLPRVFLTCRSVWCPPPRLRLPFVVSWPIRGQWPCLVFLECHSQFLLEFALAAIRLCLCKVAIVAVLG